jgi:4a-hydroxytetrahydrobiopterin dehydratase
MKTLDTRMDQFPEAHMDQQLAGLKFEAVPKGTPSLTDDQIAEFKPEIPDWDIVAEEGEYRLRREFSFGDFAEALSFTVQIGGLAELEDHHPMLLTQWGSVTVTWWTHKIGGLHKNDFVMAARTDRIYADEFASEKAKSPGR